VEFGRLWEISVFPLTKLIMDVPGIPICCESGDFRKPADLANQLIYGTISIEIAAVPVPGNPEATGRAGLLSKRKMPWKSQ
jgi:hypothetical protein